MFYNHLAFCEAFVLTLMNVKAESWGVEVLGVEALIVEVLPVEVLQVVEVLVVEVLVVEILVVEALQDEVLLVGVLEPTNPKKVEQVMNKDYVFYRKVRNWLSDTKLLEGIRLASSECTKFVQA